MNAKAIISIWSSFGPMTKPYKELDEKGMLFNFQTWPLAGPDLWPPREDYCRGYGFTMLIIQKPVISIGNMRTKDCLPWEWMAGGWILRNLTI